MITTIQKSLLAPDYLRASKTIYDTIEIPFGYMRWQLLLLADGYALLSNSHEYSQDTLEQFVQYLIRHKKPLLLHDADAPTIAALRKLYRRYRRMEIIEVEDTHALPVNSAGDLAHCSEYSSSACRTFAILPHEYIRRRMVQQRANEYGFWRGQNMLGEQSVHILGIGPNRSMLTPEAIALMAQARQLVTFDFVYELIKHIKFQGQVHVLEYHWESYDENIVRINETLGQLHLEGCYEVTLVVEGNPEVYDLLSYLSLADRVYSFEVVAPAIVLCCAWLAQDYGIDITVPGYVLISAHNMRHGICTGQLAQDLATYLRFDVACLVIELYSGDLAVIFHEVQTAQRAKAIIILIDMFTPDQQIFVLPDEYVQHLEWVESIKGKFTSVAIVDEERLQRDSSLYTKLLQDFAPDEAYVPRRVMNGASF